MSEEQEFLHKLARLVDREHQRHQALQARPQAWEIQPGSPLAGDETKSHPHDVGHGAWHALTVAQDHLLCLHSVLHSSPQGADRLMIHTHSQFTLLRAGMENAVRAVWLLQPADRAGRITRRLAMQRNESRCSAGYASSPSTCCPHSAARHWGTSSRCTGAPWEPPARSSARPPPTTS